MTEVTTTKKKKPHWSASEVSFIRSIH